jgi:hypothetical protein
MNNKLKFSQINDILFIGIFLFFCPAGAMRIHSHWPQHITNFRRIAEVLRMF